MVKNDSQLQFDDYVGTMTVMMAVCGTYTSGCVSEN